MPYSVHKDNSSVNVAAHCDPLTLTDDTFSCMFTYTCNLVSLERGLDNKLTDRLRNGSAMFSMSDGSILADENISSDSVQAHSSTVSTFLWTNYKV